MGVHCARSCRSGRSRVGLSCHQSFGQRLHHSGWVPELRPVPIRRWLGVHAGQPGACVQGDDTGLKWPVHTIGGYVHQRRVSSVVARTAAVLRLWLEKPGRGRSIWRCDVALSPGEHREFLAKVLTRRPGRKIWGVVNMDVVQRCRPFFLVVAEPCVHSMPPSQRRSSTLRGRMTQPGPAQLSISRIEAGRV